MLLPKSSSVCYHVLSLLLQGFVWSKCHFWPLFGLFFSADKKEVGVVTYADKTFPRLYRFQIYMGS